MSTSTRRLGVLCSSIHWLHRHLTSTDQVNHYLRTQCHHGSSPVMGDHTRRRVEDDHVLDSLRQIKLGIELVVLKERAAADDLDDRFWNNGQCLRTVGDVRAENTNIRSLDRPIKE